MLLARGEFIRIPTKVKGSRKNMSDIECFITKEIPKSLIDQRVCTFPDY